ncbi:MAG: chaperonin GroEL [Methylococcaceae bacterium]|nr:chaperonin GroEL [Methylococcaceae bacterium]MDZ4156920.1 chaperonin GroEL [Methylococcales bacterium]MDP2394032.1 chaperonin GroEL [Methylococcaceae bacterium]MDP3018504.1 chaperonin GroEL [Methylococcaceae bacterium]MDP3390970.1 chaperonin GroEL [Methylococcaceae bacterium]
MSKQIIYNPEARLRMMQGIDKVANAAIVTMGSAGPAVLIQHRTDGILPVFTRDGVTVARSINFDDRLADLGGRMLRDVAGAVSRQVGDGTTTAIVLAQKIAQESVKSVVAGFHPLQLKKGLDLALTLVEKHLLDTAVTGVTADWIEKISAVATKDEPGVGRLLAQALAELGSEGQLNFQLGNSRNDELEIVEGIHYEQGYLSPYFVTDKARQEAVLDNPYILLYDRDISDLMDLVPILEEVKAEGRSLLIIAENVIDKALSGLLINHVRGIFKVVAVKAPGFGDKRIDRLKDLALLTGGKAILDDYSSPKLEHVTLDMLGQAQRVVVTEGTITIIGAKGDRHAAQQLIDNLRAQADLILAKKPGQGSASGNRHDFGELEERIALLSGKTGMFSVGGTTDVEIKERMVRIENAYMSAKAALEEGVLPGGGVALYRCIKILDAVIAENAEQQQGIAIMKLALAAPLQSLTRNAGINSETVIAKLDAVDDDHLTIDTQRNSYGNFLDIGIIDPVKVMRLALRNAVSVVTTLITTEAVVMDVPDLSIMNGYSPEWAAATREDPRA